jgi:hypothetical protein
VVGSGGTYTGQVNRFLSKPGCQTNQIRIFHRVSCQKVLIIDDEYIIIGSNNGLLNFDFRNNEISIKTFDPVPL